MHHGGALCKLKEGTGHLTIVLLNELMQRCFHSRGSSDELHSWQTKKSGSSLAGTRLASEETVFDNALARPLGSYNVTESCTKSGTVSLSTGVRVRGQLVCLP